MIPIKIACSLTGSTVYLGTDTVGSLMSPLKSSLFVSGNSGQTWSASTFFKDTVHTNVRDILIHPTNVNRVWVAGTTPAPPYQLGTNADYSGDDDQAWRGTNGIWYTSNGGVSWVRKTTNLPRHAPNVLALAMSATVGDTILFAINRASNTADSVYFSSDFGSTWQFKTAFPSGSHDVRALRIRAGGGDTLIAATDNGIVVSTNRAVSFATRNNGLTDLNVRDVVIDPTSDATIYATTQRSLFKSTNLGENWTQVNVDPIATVAQAISVNTDSLFSTSKLTPSINKYKGSWSMPAEIGNARFEGLSVEIPTRNSSYVFAAGDSMTKNGSNRTDGKIYRSSNGGSTWSLVFTNPDTSISTYFTKIVPYPDQFQGYAFGLGKLSNSQYGKNMYMSTDFGVTWSANLGYTLGDGRKATLSMGIDTVNTRWYVGTEDGAYYSSNNGSNWTSTSGTTYNNIRTIAFNPASPSSIYYGSDNWLRISTNSGVSVSTASLRVDSVRNIVMHPSYPNYNQFLWIQVGSTKLYKTTDAGSTWTDVTGNLPTPITDFRRDPFNSAYFYAATGSGVYKINPAPEDVRDFVMSGTNCEPCDNEERMGRDGGGETDNLGGCNVRLDWTANWEADLGGYAIERSIDGGAFEAWVTPTYGEVSATDNSVVLAPLCDGAHTVKYRITAHDNASNTSGAVYSARANAKTVPAQKATVKSERQPEFKLWQNTPNPFNPTTTIRFDLPIEGQVQLVLYDILGRQVKTLVNGWESAGSHELLIDASDLSSGIYFYTIRAGKHTESRKLMLMK